VHAFAERPPAGSRFACLREAATAKAGHAGVVPKNHTHLRQGSRLPKNLFGEQVGGSSANQPNPPKHDRIIAYGNSDRSDAFLHDQGRGPLRRQMTKLLISVQF